ncbi:mRNA decay activator protein ZFP36-like [Rhinatrema bivittatum]|uniref:mRNA decay activator protein ZFP36-like n=1 Tax=Rhinatrema bivittatum TaxID=194408 RepID=UPI00112AF2BF|nr:mRNA decay activator protein ZFP36-like [Rhinatrema bivittatum]
MSSMLDIHTIFENLRNLSLLEDPEALSEKSVSDYQRRRSSCGTQPAVGKQYSSSSSSSGSSSREQLLDLPWPQQNPWSLAPSSCRLPFRTDRSLSLTESAMGSYGSSRAQVPPPPGFPPLKPAVPVLSSRYKTELCRTFSETGKCKYGSKCQFAHGFQELRTLSRHPKYKTELCHKFYLYGECPYGSRCNFIHYPEERGFPLPHHLRQSLSFSGVPGILEPSSSPPPADLPGGPGCCNCRYAKASSRLSPAAAQCQLPATDFLPQQPMPRSSSASSLSDQDCYSSSSSLSGSESPVFEPTGGHGSGSKRLPIFNRLSVSD